MVDFLQCTPPPQQPYMSEPPSSWFAPSSERVVITSDALLGFEVRSTSFLGCFRCRYRGLLTFLGRDINDEHNNAVLVPLPLTTNTS